MRAEPAGEAPPRKEWSTAPWTVQLFAAANLFGFIAWFVVNGFDGWPRAAFGFALSLLIVWGLFRGYLGAWSVAMAFAALGTLGAISTVVSWSRPLPGSRSFSGEIVSLTIWAVTTAALLHPATRRWVGLKRV